MKNFLPSLDIIFLSKNCKHSSCMYLFFFPLFFVFCSVLSFEGGLVFVNPLRERNCVTMLDPFHIKYGKAVTAVLSLVSLFLDVVWVPTTLTGLGTVYQPVLIPSSSDIYNLPAMCCLTGDVVPRIEGKPKNTGHF